MKDWDFVEAFSQIDERFIEEAEDERTRKKIKKFDIFLLQLRLAFVCFCYCLIYRRKLPMLCKAYRESALIFS